MNKELARLKRKAKKALIAYRAIADEADCGGTLLQEISGRAARAARHFNEAMEALEKLDPDCPQGQRL